jgi:hypothetical protein
MYNLVDIWFSTFIKTKQGFGKWHVINSKLKKLLWRVEIGKWCIHDPLIVNDYHTLVYIMSRDDLVTDIGIPTLNYQ